MRLKIGNLLVTAVEIGGVLGLVGITISETCKRRQAEKARSKAEWKATIYEFCNYVDGVKIKDLEKELNELRAKKGEA